MNAVQFIQAYRHPKAPNVWVFDDERFGLVEEPFVAGASEAIDRLAAIVGATDRINLTFSAAPLPNAQRTLKRLSNGELPEKMGATYHDGTDQLWLCPAMMHFFDGPLAPEAIYVYAAAPAPAPV